MKRLIKRASSLLVLSALISGVTACGTSKNFNQNSGLNGLDQVNTFAARPRSNGKKWTIAIHMAADNNLYSAGLDDINEMEAGLASDQVDVIVLFDGSPTGDSKIYKIAKDKNGYDKTIVSEVVDDKGAIIPPSHEINSGDPKVFAKFVDWVTKNYPADNNFVAIWNHGSGIFRNTQGGSFGDLLTKPTSGSNKSFSSDDHGGSMYLKDLNPALEIGAANLGKPIDMLGFDTCLMGHLETAYQVKGLANYLVASEELEPGDGWDYQGFLAAVSADPAMSPAQASTALVDAYGKSYAPGGSQSGSAVTLSAIDINALVNGLVPAINQFGTDLSANLASVKPTLTSVRSQTQVFFNRDAADLGDFLGKLSKNVSLSDDIKTSAAKVRSELEKVIIRETHSGKPIPATKGSVAGATGLVVYFPNSSMSYNPKYDNVEAIRFAEQKEWGSFLKAFTKK